MSDLSNDEEVNEPKIKKKQRTSEGGEKTREALSKSKKKKQESESEQEEASEQSEEEDNKKRKSNKKSESSKKTNSSNKDIIIERDQIIFEMGNKKRMSIRKFKGKLLIDFREFWQPDGEDDLKPTKKGVSLNIDQWEKLKKFIPKIDEAIDNMRQWVTLCPEAIQY
eukprot:TRINITY_DN2079_c0_g1_i1.p1 TRINITY_DN2079_c0_g1~~TRINITY_DN2079_c0_g1_i1.p1  ORF type:complete len:167 (+),score=57.02 TRINITY_DN2079_c0_g1_i1:120-620(+)